MENKLLEIKKCECGKQHFLSTEKIVVSDNAFSFMLDFICEKKYRSILFFDDEKSENEVEFSNKMKISNIAFKIKTIENCFATEYLAKTIENDDSEIVVVFGKEELISVCKYYCALYEKQIIICPIGNFTDFTFSSFSRLYDGVCFCFYKTVSPLAIFVNVTEKANKFQTYYLSSKFIALFDNEFAKLVFKQETCPRLSDFFSKTMKDYILKNNMSLSEKNVWTLIRLGQAMTFFDETKYFYGGDKLVLDVLQSLSKNGDFLELETIALKIIVSSYDCFLKNPHNYNVANLNLHIRHISELYKIPQTETIKRMGDSKILLPDEKTRNSFGNFQPYLRQFFQTTMSKVFKIQTTFCIVENVLKKNNFCGEKVKRAFSVSATFSKKPTLLGLIMAYGFMDKLFE